MPNPETILPPANAGGLKKLICSLILGSDHPISASEIQRILEAVAEEDRLEAENAAKEVSDEELEALAEVPELAQQVAAAPVADDYSRQPSAISLSAIKTAIREVQTQFHDLDLGIALDETADGFRFHTSSDCGKWIRKMLNKGKPQRLPRSAVETLAIIAYRQPVARSEIESIRGVSAGHVIKALMEMQLVRIIGRSDLPGRPFLFGTTQTFLDHFGLKTLNELEPALKREKEN